MCNWCSSRLAIQRIWFLHWLALSIISCDCQLTIELILHVSVHCPEEGCIGKYIPRGPRDFPRAGILHPKAWSRGPQFHLVSATNNVLTFCLPVNFYSVPICIIAMYCWSIVNVFCVTIFAPVSVLGNILSRAVFANTLPREQGVYWKIWCLRSYNLISCDQVVINSQIEMKIISPKYQRGDHII